MVLGLASDGKEARIPREGVVGADLDFDESGKSWAQDNLVTVYMGIPISALPSIINNGPSASLRLEDMMRQKLWKKAHPGRVFADPEQRYMRVMYVSRKKATAACYPMAMHASKPFKGYKGEVICADGSGLWAAVLQGMWTRKTGKGEFTARWERAAGTNDQVAVSP